MRSFSSAYHVEPPGLLDLHHLVDQLEQGLFLVDATPRHVVHDLEQCDALGEVEFGDGLIVHDGNE